MILDGAFVPGNADANRKGYLQDFGAERRRWTLPVSRGAFERTSLGAELDFDSGKCRMWNP